MNVFMLWKKTNRYLLIIFSLFILVHVCFASMVSLQWEWFMPAYVWVHSLLVSRVTDVLFFYVALYHTFNALIVVLSRRKISVRYFWLRTTSGVFFVTFGLFHAVFQRVLVELTSVRYALFHLLTASNPTLDGLYVLLIIFAWYHLITSAWLRSKLSIKFGKTLKLTLLIVMLTPFLIKWIVHRPLGMSVQAEQAWGQSHLKQSMPVKVNSNTESFKSLERNIRSQHLLITQSSLLWTIVFGAGLLVLLWFTSLVIWIRNLMIK